MSGANLKSMASKFTNKRQQSYALDEIWQLHPFRTRTVFMIRNPCASHNVSPLTLQVSPSTQPHFLLRPRQSPPRRVTMWAADGWVGRACCRTWRKPGPTLTAYCLKLFRAPTAFLLLQINWQKWKMFTSASDRPTANANNLLRLYTLLRLVSVLMVFPSRWVTSSSVDWWQTTGAAAWGCAVCSFGHVRPWCSRPVPPLLFQAFLNADSSTQASFARLSFLTLHFINWKVLQRMSKPTTLNDTIIIYNSHIYPNEKDIRGLEIHV